ncbi:MAG: AmmeMemoRadiSam system protein A [Sedimentisphaerales bacterium]|nr:AmmeMemoRadiSam system protein A [Sedimentisphaerales bacterium]
MTETQKNLLLNVARDSVTAAVKGTSVEIPKANDPELLAHCGCFVTLKNGHELRGCIGNFVSDKPLIELVHDMAVAAATEDSRFSHNPITVHELHKLDIEISVLSPLKKTDDPLSLRLGIDGIYITRGRTSGCLLPQVATETGWTKEQFLSYCCDQKAGLPPNAWKDKNTNVYLFSADVFGS